MSLKLDYLKPLILLLATIGITKSLSLVKESVVARVFGTGLIVDFFQVSTTYITWLPALIASILVPVVVTTVARIQSDPIKVASFYNEARPVIRLLTLFVGIASFVSVYFFYGKTSGYSTEFLYLLPLPFGVTLYSIYSAFLQAKRSILYSLLEIILSLLTIVLVLIFRNAHSLVLSITLGYVLMAIGSMYMSDRIYRKPLLTSHKSGCWKLFLTNISFLTISQLLLSFTTVIDVRYASKLDIGSVSTYAYVMKLSSIVTAIISVILGRIFLPSLAEKSASLSREQYRKFVIKIATMTTLCSSVFVLAGIVWANDIVRIVYQGGAFTALDSIKVSFLLRIVLFQFLFIASTLFSQALLALEHAKILVLISLAILVIKFSSLNIFPTTHSVEMLGTSIVLVSIGSFVLSGAFFWVKVIKK